jgi:hypothetical protein
MDQTGIESAFSIGLPAKSREEFTDGRAPLYIRFSSWAHLACTP